MRSFQILNSRFGCENSFDLGPHDVCDGVVWKENAFEKWLECNGLRHGLCESLNAGVRSCSYYWNGRLHGPCEHYSVTGQLLSRSFFVEGKREGESLFWHANGTLAKELRYANDQLDGTQLYYAPEGFLKTRLCYEEGKACGLLEHFHQNGSPARKVLFKNGLKEGVEKVWYENGRIQTEREFKNGCPVGISQSWYESGQLAEKIEYLNPSWKFHMRRYSASSRPLYEGLTLEDGSFEEKKFSDQGSLSLHRLCLRDSAGKVTEEKILFRASL